MHLFFIDDSGTISPPEKISQKYFVLGGLVIPEDRWCILERQFSEICKNFDVNGEIKWRFFGQRRGREDKENTLSHLNILERDNLRSTLLQVAINDESIKVIVIAIHLPTIYNSEQIKKPEKVHEYAHESLISSFQLYLQTQSQTVGTPINGIIISDHRNPFQDAAQRNLHMSLVNANNSSQKRYPNLIEGLFFAPSHHSIGIQFADLISGAVFRYYEHNDDRWYRLLRKNLYHTEKKDAESGSLANIPEPA